MLSEAKDICRQVDNLFSKSGVFGGTSNTVDYS